MRALLTHRSVIEITAAFVVAIFCCAIADAQKSIEVDSKRGDAHAKTASQNSDERLIELAPPFRLSQNPGSRPLQQSRQPPTTDPSLEAAITDQSSAPPSIAALQKLITELARQHIPHDFEDTSDWGMTDERWDGIKFERDGIRLETRRRKKEVNHGSWKMYRAEMVNPRKNLVVRIENLRRSKDGKIRFDIDFVARINIHGRVSKWVKGVQLYSFSADAIADLRLRVSCRLGTNLDFSKLPPDLVLTPKVTDADLEMTDFKLIRISKAGGEVAQQLGRAAEKKLREKVEEKEAKLVKKANASIEKHKGEFRLSPADFLENQWSDLASKLLSHKTISQLKKKD